MTERARMSKIEAGDCHETCEEGNMKKAKLQLALDDVLLEDALELVRSVAGFVDDQMPPSPCLLC